MPPLWPSNVDAVRIWNLVQDQRIWVSSMGGTFSIALKHEPIWKLIDELEIEDRIGTFEKILKVFNHIKKIEDNKMGG